MYEGLVCLSFDDIDKTSNSSKKINYYNIGQPCTPQTFNNKGNNLVKSHDLKGDIMRYLSIKGGQFCFFDNVIGSSIESRLNLDGKRFLQWTSSGLTSEKICRDESQVPPGWTLAYDLDLLIDNVDYRLTIHDGAIMHAFKPYLGQLQAQGMSLEEVITKISIEASPRGYPALRFEAVGSSAFG